MHVRWKTLLGLGTIFWISMCLFDYYFINPVTKLYYSDHGEYDWLAHVAEEEIALERQQPIREDTIKFPAEEGYYSFGVSLAVWNISIFFTTILVCYLSTLTFQYALRYKEKYTSTRVLQNSENILRLRSSNSKIPILQPQKFDDVDEKIKDTLIIDSCVSLLTTSSTNVDLTIRPSKSEMCSKAEQQMERQCSKMRDEMITLQANSLKEHAALSRKLESVSKEKRDLYRQLMIVQKENRAAKQQLEELITEKTLLVKRLECASREFKANTKSKKMALANLEESQSTIAALRHELEKETYDKEVLESKLKILNAEHKNIKERLSKFEAPPQDSFKSIKVRLSEPMNTVIDPSQNLKTDFFELSQSQKDVQRVQMRLMNLEKSLDKLKLINWGKKEEDRSRAPTPKSSPTSSRRSTSPKSSKTSPTRSPTTSLTETPLRATPVVPTQNGYAQVDSDKQLGNMNSSCIMRAEEPLEQHSSEIEEMLLRSDNLTDEQRRKILDPAESSLEDNSSGSKSFNNLIEIQIEDPFERVGSLLNFIKRSPPQKKNRLKANLSEIPYNTETSTSVNDEDDTDDWEPPKVRMVSNSPAFQRFLQKMDPADRTRNKFPSSESMVF